MKQLHFDYRMMIHYSEPVKICHFTIKCIPRTDKRQRLIEKKITIDPEIAYEENIDSFGNKQIYGYVDCPHDSFSFRITGDIIIEQILYEEEVNENRIMIFRNPYGMNVPGEMLREYFSDIGLDETLKNYEKCLFLMHRLHRDFSYEKGCTNVTTGAEEAWRLRKGVCQDYAHIFIALLHMAGIPARYVTGLIAGEGASHAWVEALCQDKWIGFDPTNDLLVADFHIKLGDGRDASDCMINRGVMRGGGNQIQEIYVTVE